MEPPQKAHPGGKILSYEGNVPSVERAHRAVRRAERFAVAAVAVAIAAPILLVGMPIYVGVPIAAVLGLTPVALALRLLAREWKAVLQTDAAQVRKILRNGIATTLIVLCFAAAAIGILLPIRHNVFESEMEQARHPRPQVFQWEMSPPDPTKDSSK